MKAVLFGLTCLANLFLTESFKREFSSYPRAMRNRTAFELPDSFLSPGSKPKCNGAAV